AEEELGLRHVRIKTGEGNEASVRLAEALGFSRTEDTEQKSEGILTFEKYMQTDMR
ncbi:N-acetyltransferase, partial [Salmonella enterica subsp. enterica serovar Enteritidis]|nr:N-acetyltransferase [Salmonella enterica subsp. enterica serovar Enteritidis]